MRGNWSSACDGSLARKGLFKHLMYRGRPLATGGRSYLAVKTNSVTAWSTFTVTWSARMGHKCFKCLLKDHLLGMLPEMTNTLDQVVRSDDFYGALRWDGSVIWEVCYLLTFSAAKQSVTDCPLALSKQVLSPTTGGGVGGWGSGKDGQMWL